MKNTDHALLQSAILRLIERFDDAARRAYPHNDDFSRGMYSGIRLAQYDLIHLINADNERETY